MPLHMQLTEWPTKARCIQPQDGRRIRLKSENVDFSALVRSYGSGVVASWLDAMALAASHHKLSSPGHSGRALLMFLQYLAASGADPASTKPESRTYSRLLDGTVPELMDLEECYLGFIERARDLADNTLFGERSARSRLNQIGSLRGTLRTIGPYLGWPQMSLGKNYGVGIRATLRPTPSLGELRGAEAPRNPDHSPQVARLNRERLSALREVLAEIFDEAWRTYRDGADRIARPTLPTQDELERAVAELPLNYAKHGYDPDLPTITNRCFPLGDDDFRRSALLKYFVARYRDDVVVGGAYTSWRRLLKSCGGVEWLGPRIAGDGRALAAAQGIILIDTGFNLQPCNDLLSEPVAVRARHGKQTLSTVTSRKMRAGGKLVMAVLQEYEADVPLAAPKISSLEVIARWREMSSRFRKYAECERPNLAKYLWIRAPLSNLKAIQIAPADGFHWASLQKTIQLHAKLRGLSISRRCIRTTALQIRLSESELDVSAATIVANHSNQSTTVRHYFNHGWFHSEMDQLIRAFQNQFEAILLSTAPTPLQVSPAELASRRRDAIESGLGLLCLAPRQQQPRCLALERCATCEMMRFSPSETALRALVLTERSLSAAQETFASQNPERWARYWLPTLALVRAIAARLAEGHHRTKLRAATADVDHNLAAGKLLAVQPW